MMMMTPMQQAIAEVALEDSSEAQTASTLSKRASVPSKSVRSKKKDEHKKHLNKKVVQNRLNPKLDAKRHISDDDLAAVLEECRRTALQQPPREFDVAIETPALHELCKNTVQYLYTVGKVQAYDKGGADVDAENLEKVVIAQATTKVHLARHHNGKLTNTAEVDYMNRVEKRFTVLPKVANVYLEQVGWFEFEGQTFVPRMLPPLTFRKLNSAQFMTTLTRNGPAGEERAIMTIPPEYVQNYVINGTVTDPIEVVTQGHGTITWVPVNGLGDFRDLCVWYEDFISRCSRKAGSILQNVTFGKGEGTIAQLVGSRYDERIHQLEIWCNKKIDQNTLQIGGLFAYGYNSKDKLHDEEIASITDRMDTEGMFQRIQRCQKL